MKLDLAIDYFDTVHELGEMAELAVLREDIKLAKNEAGIKD